MYQITMKRAQKKTGCREEIGGCQVFELIMRNSDDRFTSLARS